MKKKYFLIFPVFILAFAGLSGFAQNKIYLGMDSGLAIFKTEVDNLEGEYFKGQKTFTLAPTGFNINIETGVNWCVEFGASIQFFDDNSISHGSGGSSGSQRAASSYHFKLKRLIFVGNKFTFAPFVGLTKVNIDSESNYLSEYSKIGTGSTIVNGVITRDSMFSQHFYEVNVITAPIVGLDVSYKIAPRLNVCMGFSYFHSPQYTSFQFVEYFKEGQPVKSAIISYGGSGFFIQAGFKWNWRDIVKPGKYTLIYTL